MWNVLSGCGMSSVSVACHELVQLVISGCGMDSVCVSMDSMCVVLPR